MWVKVEDKLPPVGEFNKWGWYEKNYPVRVKGWKPEHWIQARYLVSKIGDELFTSWNASHMNGDLNVVEWFDLPL